MGSLSITGTLKVASWEVIFGKDGERKAGRGVVNWEWLIIIVASFGMDDRGKPDNHIRLSRPWWVARA